MIADGQGEEISGLVMDKPGLERHEGAKPGSGNTLTRTLGIGFDYTPVSPDRSFHDPTSNKCVAARPLDNTYNRTGGRSISDDEIRLKRRSATHLLQGGQLLLQEGPGSRYYIVFS